MMLLLTARIGSADLLIERMGDRDQRDRDPNARRCLLQGVENLSALTKPNNLHFKPLKTA
jgi:hypothetical protein